MLHRLLYIRPPTNAGYQIKPERLSDEDNEILSIMGPDGLNLKYQLKEEERQHAYALGRLLLSLCR